jgi:hypothetical protein
MVNKFPGWALSDKFKKVSLKKFITTLPKHEVIEAMEIAINKKEGCDRSGVIPYFCGVCWRKIRKNNGEEF